MADPRERYNRVLDQYRRLWLLYLLRSEAAWGERMKRFGAEVQALILEHADESGQVTGRQDLRRGIHRLSQGLGADLERHLKERITVSAMLGARATSDATRAYVRTVRDGDGEDDDAADQP